MRIAGCTPCSASPARPQDEVTRRADRRLLASTRRGGSRPCRPAARPGVAPGQPVRAPDGLIGRVLETGRWASRVLLITDGASNVPVRLVRDGTPALAVGRGDGTIELRTLEVGQNPFRRGDIFVTSGTGGIFPPDIPVARGDRRPRATPRSPGRSPIRRGSISRSCCASTSPPPPARSTRRAAVGRRRRSPARRRRPGAAAAGTAEQSALPAGRCSSRRRISSCSRAPRRARRSAAAMSRIAGSETEVAIRDLRRRYVPLISTLAAIAAGAAADRRRGAAACPISASWCWSPGGCCGRKSGRRRSRSALGLAADLVSGAPLGQSMLLWTATFLALDYVDSLLGVRDYWIDWVMAAAAILFHSVGVWYIALLMGSDVELPGDGAADWC